MVSSSSSGGVRSELLQSSGVLALLHTAEGDVNDGDQPVGGAQRAEQPVRVGLAQDPQDVALVEAQLAGLGGDVVAQGPNFTEEKKTKTSPSRHFEAFRNQIYHVHRLKPSKTVVLYL